MLKIYYVIISNNIKFQYKKGLVIIMSNDNDVNIRAIYTAKGAYHNHKETMAHAGLLLLVAIFGYVMTAEQWPPCWVDSDLIFFIGISLVLTLVYMFIRWQLIHRRSAAIKFAALERILLKDINIPNKTTLDEYEKKFSDLFIPRKNVYIDDNIEYLDNQIKGAIEQQIKNGTDAVKSEKILCTGSVLMILLISWRTACFIDILCCRILVSLPIWIILIVAIWMKTKDKK